MFLSSNPIMYYPCYLPNIQFHPSPDTSTIGTKFSFDGSSDLISYVDIIIQRSRLKRHGS